MPTTTVASFGAGFADPDLIRGTRMWTLSASRRASASSSQRQEYQ